MSVKDSNFMQVTFVESYSDGSSDFQTKQLSERRYY